MSSTNQDTSTDTNMEPAPASSQPTADATKPSILDDTPTSTPSKSGIALLQQLLDFVGGDLDKAEKLALLIARLSPHNPLSLLSPTGGAGYGPEREGCCCGPPSTSTSVGQNSAASAAASSAGIASTCVAPNAAATAIGVPPSLLTDGSTSSSTAVPLSDIQTVPAGTTTVTLNFTTTTNEVGGTTARAEVTPSTTSAKSVGGQGQQASSTTATSRQPVQAQRGGLQQQKPRAIGMQSLRGSASQHDFPWKDGQD